MLRVLFALLLIPLAASAQPIPPTSSPSAQGYLIGNVAAATTVYAAAGSTSGNQNGGLVAAKRIALSNLYIRVATAPAATQSDVFTIYAGPAGAMSATSLTCTVAAGTQACNDTTDIVAVNQGDSWALQVVTGATNPTGPAQVGIAVQ